jgi:hypothetical protein
MNPVKHPILAAVLFAATVHGQSPDEDLLGLFHPPRPIELVAANDSPALPATETGSIETTLCEIVKAPLRFHKRLVRIRATTELSVDAGYLLSVQNCGLFLDLPLSTNDYQIRKLEESIGLVSERRGRRTIRCMGSRAEAIFTGRIVYALDTSGDNTTRFELEAVSDLIPGPTCGKK